MSDAYEREKEIARSIEIEIEIAIEIEGDRKKWSQEVYCEIAPKEGLL